MSDFKIGDLVEAFGVTGEVQGTDCHRVYPIIVKFILGEGCRYEYFTDDGRAEPWHVVPSLELISRLKEQDEN